MLPRYLIPLRLADRFKVREFHIRLAYPAAHPIAGWAAKLYNTTSHFPASVLQSHLLEQGCQFFFNIFLLLQVTYADIMSEPEPHISNPLIHPGERGQPWVFSQCLPIISPLSLQIHKQVLHSRTPEQYIHTMGIVVCLAAKVPLGHDIFHETFTELFVHIAAPGDVVPQPEIYLAGSGDGLRIVDDVQLFCMGAECYVPVVICQELFLNKEQILRV